MGDITSDAIATPRKAKKHFKRAKEKVDTQRKQTLTAVFKTV